MIEFSSLFRDCLGFFLSCTFVRFCVCIVFRDVCFLFACVYVGLVDVDIEIINRTLYLLFSLVSLFS